MLIDYNQFDIIKYKEYLVDHKSNIQLLEALQEFILSANNNLNYHVAGSLALSLLSNKIYRTWKDIDIVIEYDSIYKWIKYLPKNKWHYNDINKDSVRIFYSKYNNYIELITEDKSLYYYNKKYLKIQEIHGVKVSNPKTIFFWKKTQRAIQKQTDIDDEIFYSKYLNLFD